VNYANDYSDGIRGTDEFRVGPVRLTASGRVNPKVVRNVAFLCFGIAAIAGLVVVFMTQLWWLILVGIACVLAAWFYTGGKKPYGYNAMGELFVFVFFGLVATVGTTFVQVKQFTNNSLFAAIGVGLLACAVLVINNIRDIQQDKLAKKRTLSVLIGKRASIVLYVVFTLVPFAILGLFLLLYPGTLFGFIALLTAIPACVIAIWGRTPKEYILALQLSGFTILIYGLGLGLGLALS
jgi:1,4-dihydroxy-2-naphthoate octaprenyltransferase